MQLVNVFCLRKGKGYNTLKNYWEPMQPTAPTPFGRNGVFRKNYKTLVSIESCHDIQYSLSKSKQS